METRENLQELTREMYIRVAAQDKDTNQDSCYGSGYCSTNMITIELLQEKHWLNVREIYLEGIRTGHATFETTAPEWPQWDNAHLAHSRFVAVEDAQVIGWAALTPVSGRCVYAGVAEVSVYVSEAARGKKVGTLLLEHLIRSSEERGIWTLQAGIFPENAASVHLHEKSGFRVIGRRERIGKLGGVWRDTILLERRSKTVGA